MEDRDCHQHEEEARHRDKHHDHIWSIITANAVIDEQRVTFEIDYALVTRSAVLGHTCLYNFAFGADSLRLDLAKQRECVGTLWVRSLEEARMGLLCQNEACQSQDESHGQQILEQPCLHMWKDYYHLQ